MYDFPKSVDYRACQRADGRWDFCATVEDKAFPIGYCRPFASLDLYGTSGLFVAPVSLSQKARKLSDRFHDCGHATEADANECWMEFLFDTHRFDSGARFQRCMMCGDGTTTRLVFSENVTWEAPLCAIHISDKQGIIDCMRLCFRGTSKPIHKLNKYPKLLDDALRSMHYAAHCIERNLTVSVAALSLKESMKELQKDL